MNKSLAPLVLLVLFGAGCWSKPQSATQIVPPQAEVIQPEPSAIQTEPIAPTATSTQPVVQPKTTTTAPKTKTTQPKTTTAPMPSTSGSGSTLPISAKVYVSVTDTGFSPQVIALSAGDTVVWTNKGTISHSVFSDNSIIFNGGLAPGASYSHVFKYSGSYSYHCGAHPNLKGTVVVR